MGILDKPDRLRYRLVPKPKPAYTSIRHRPEDAEPKVELRLQLLLSQHARLQRHCRAQGIAVADFVRDLIVQAIGDPDLPQRLVEGIGDLVEEINRVPRRARRPTVSAR